MEFDTELDNASLEVLYYYFWISGANYKHDWKLLEKAHQVLMAFNQIARTLVDSLDQEQRDKYLHNGQYLLETCMGVRLDHASRIKPEDLQKLPKYKCLVAAHLKPNFCSSEVSGTLDFTFLAYRAVPLQVVFPRAFLESLEVAQVSQTPAPEPRELKDTKQAIDPANELEFKDTDLVDRPDLDEAPAELKHSAQRPRPR